MNTLKAIEDHIRQLTVEDRERLERWFFTQPFANDHESWRVEEPAAAYKFPRQPRPLSVDEYFELESASPIRHEYVAGELFAMCGVSRAHNHITRNLVIAFGERLRGSPCEVFMMEFKLKFQVDRLDIVYYPDVMVACGREGIRDLYLDNPKLVVEVLSPSTARTDRREKALMYRRIATLEEYVVAAQDKPQVTIFRRDADWQPMLLTVPESIVEFRSIGLAVPLSQIYEGI
jgi:Uma2 family endonuclease